MAPLSGEQTAKSKIGDYEIALSDHHVAGAPIRTKLLMWSSPNNRKNRTLISKNFPAIVAPSKQERRRDAG